jgi:hypothetical protein
MSQAQNWGWASWCFWSASVRSVDNQSHGWTRPCPVLLANQLYVALSCTCEHVCPSLWLEACVLIEGMSSSTWAWVLVLPPALPGRLVGWLWGLWGVTDGSTSWLGSLWRRPEWPFLCPVLSSYHVGGCALLWGLGAGVFHLWQKNLWPGFDSASLGNLWQPGFPEWGESLSRDCKNPKYTSRHLDLECERKFWLSRICPLLMGNGSSYLRPWCRYAHVCVCVSVCACVGVCSYLLVWGVATHCLNQQMSVLPHHLHDTLQCLGFFPIFIKQC